MIQSKSYIVGPKISHFMHLEREDSVFYVTDQLQVPKFVMLSLLSDVANHIKGLNAI